MILPKQSAEDLFARALELEPSDRPAFLDRVCRGDAALRLLIEELLREDERAGSFLRRPIVSGIAEPTASDAGSAYSRDDAAPPRFPAGETIAQRFRVVRFIARGGMGEVYEVEDRLLHGNRVALKVVLPEIAADEESAHRFEQEVLLARKINHPNLCPIYEIFHSEEPTPFLFLTMKLLAGETLDASLRKRVLLPREEACDIFRQMVAGIAAIHDAGVVHRDIKPTNVMLDRSGLRLQLSIMDFGLARLNESEATMLRPGAIAGTPGYLAPELLRGHRPSRATDIFALGVLLHQVLTGERPRESADGMLLMPTPALDRAAMPAAHIQAVRDFLAEEPVVRVRAFDQVRDRLDAGSGHYTLAMPRAPRVWTRRQMLVGSGAACAALAGGVYWNRDSISEYLHPLPLKRFVALVGWPPSGDAKLRPMLTSLIDAISSELSRAEAYDHNLFLIPHFGSEVATTAQLDDVRESLGANLVLAASAVRSNKNLHVSLDVLPPSSSKALRSKEIRVAENEQLSLAQRAVRAAADLLDIQHYEPDEKRMSAGTTSPDAYAAFQAAEALRHQDNDKGLEAAIEKYKQALRLDSRYAVAGASLALAYSRLFYMNHDPAAMLLARANAEAALALDPSLVFAHAARAFALQQSGDNAAALHEMAAALSLDPANSVTLVWQAQIFQDLNQWANAEESFRRALHLRPNDWLARNEFGALLQDQGKYSKALVEFRAASLTNPRNAEALCNLGSMYLCTGRPKEAVERLEQSLRLNATAVASATMSAALRMQGNARVALNFARQATALDPGEGTAWLELADTESTIPEMAAESKNSSVEGARVQRENADAFPTDGPRWLLLSLLEAKAGALDEARSHLEQGDGLPSSDLGSQLYKTRTLEVLGMREKSLIVLEDCLRRGATQFQITLMPEMKALMKDVRFQQLMKQIGTGSSPS